MSYDYIIVGADITGITAAEQLANAYNKKVLLIDKNDHIGGEYYDYHNEDDILVQKYGPHVFHTNNEEIYNYLSLFTNWNSYNHKVVSKVDSLLIPIPFNLISVEKCMSEDAQEITSALLTDYLVNDRVPLDKLKESENPMIQSLILDIYEKLYKPYMEKKYGVSLNDLDKESIEKAVMSISYDCRLYQDMRQTVPTNGFTVMFENMLSNHNITILLEKDFRDIITIDYSAKKIYYNEEEFAGEIIYTGMIDEFFNYEYGKLGYRTAVFLDETVSQIYFQENATITYPKDNHFTQITEYKYLTGQQITKSTIQFEFPIDYNPKYPESSVPLYPIPTHENLELYEKYNRISKQYPQVTFIGKLAQYKNINMDKLVEDMLNLIRNKFKGV